MEFNRDGAPQLRTGAAPRRRVSIVEFDTNAEEAVKEKIAYGIEMDQLKHERHRIKRERRTASNSNLMKGRFTEIPKPTNNTGNIQINRTGPTKHQRKGTGWSGIEGMDPKDLNAGSNVTATRTRRRSSSGGMPATFLEIIRASTKPKATHERRQSTDGGRRGSRHSWQINRSQDGFDFDDGHEQDEYIDINDVTVHRVKKTVWQRVVDQLPDMKIKDRYGRLVIHLKLAPKLGFGMKCLVIAMHIFIAAALTIPFELPFFTIYCWDGRRKSGLSFEFLPDFFHANMIGTVTKLSYSSELVEMQTPTVHGEAAKFKAVFDILSTSLSLVWIKTLFCIYQFMDDDGDGVAMTTVALLSFFTVLAMLETLSGAAVVQDADSMMPERAGKELCGSLTPQIVMGQGQWAMWTATALTFVLAVLQFIICTHPRFTQDRTEYAVMKQVAGIYKKSGTGQFTANRGSKQKKGRLQKIPPTKVVPGRNALA